MADVRLENRSHWENEELKLDERVYQAMWPGGEAAINRLAKQGKHHVRQLIATLIDEGTELFELCRLAGFGMDLS